MLTIAWDVDDVLNDLMRLWFEKEWSPAHPDCTLKYNDITENPPNRLLGVNESEYHISLDTFRLSKAAEQMLPVPEVLSWFNRYGDRFIHIALTARSIQTVPAASAWVFRHFGKWIRSFHFIPAKRKYQIVPKYHQSKTDFLCWLGKVDILVDDNQSNVSSARAMGINCILIPRAWNHGKTTIEQALDELLKELK